MDELTQSESMRLAGQEFLAGREKYKALREGLPAEELKLPDASHVAELLLLLGFTSVNISLVDTCTVRVALRHLSLDLWTTN